MLNFDDIQLQKISAGFQPTMVIVVDTEEEFDWKLDFSRDFTETNNIGEQWRAHEVYERFNARPTYVVDHCVASQDKPSAIMRDLYSQGLCDIGVHLHPWVTPPHDEVVSIFNSYHGNLAKELERAKMAEMFERVSELRGSKPTVFKAGRYGVGPNTADLLEEFGFQVDCSVLSHADLSADGGPDFSDLPESPYWFKGRTILEVPITKVYFGFARKFQKTLGAFIEYDVVKALKIRAILSRMKVINQATLTPEGIPKGELRDLMFHQAKSGMKVFNMSYHSSTLEVGGSPYVNNEQDRIDFLERIKFILDVFINEIGGRVITVQELRDELVLLN